MSTSLTVADVVANPSLGTHLVSGAQGLDRTVLWAHSCEMQDPHRWLGPNELLMTIGMCIPPGSRAQRDFIAELDNAGLAGITIGDHQIAPRLTKAMIAESDARGFPILSTDVHTPFAAIGRTVAAANADSQTMGVLRLAKLYQVVSQQTPESRRSGAPLRDLFGTPLTVIDDETGCVVIGDGGPHLGKSRSHALGTHRPTHLVVENDAQLDAFSLVHLSRVLAVDANSILQTAAEAVRESTAALEAALRWPARAGQAVAQVWKEDVGSFRTIVCDEGLRFRVPLALTLAGLRPLTAPTGGRLVIVVPVDELAGVRSVLDTMNATAGVSAEHWNVRDIDGAMEEAVSEFVVALRSDEIWREFRGERLTLLARSRSEADQIIEQVLGPLATVGERNTELRETLFSFLDHDLSWTRTAGALGLHRQSLVYRLNQVENVTGRSVRSMSDLSEFWLARKAWKTFVVSNTRYD